MSGRGVRERLRMLISIIIFVWRARESESSRTSIKLRPAFAREHASGRNRTIASSTRSLFLWFNGLKDSLVCNDPRVAPFFLTCFPYRPFVNRMHWLDYECFLRSLRKTLWSDIIDAPINTTINACLLTLNRKNWIIYQFYNNIARE